MAKRKKKEPEKKTLIDKVVDILDKAGKLKRTRRMAAAGVVSAVVGGLLKAVALTQTFPEPYDTWGNLILFAALLLIVADIAQGGLYD